MSAAKRTIEYVTGVTPSTTKAGLAAGADAGWPVAGLAVLSLLTDNSAFTGA
jgi:hypothetical protein